MRGVQNTIFVLLACFLLAGCWYDYEWRQKLTMVVETPDGDKSGSAVSRVGITESDGPLTFPEARGARSSIKGEAVVVEVLPGKYLFALISGANTLAQKVFAPELGLDRRPVDMPDLETWAEQLSQMRSRKTVPLDSYPLLVTFNDINDPKTVKKVDPNNLAATFGPGVRLKTITLKITDEPVTEGKVEEALAWWGNKELLKQIWPKISSEMRSTLSTVNWKKG